MLQIYILRDPVIFAGNMADRAGGKFGDIKAKRKLDASNLHPARSGHIRRKYGG